jgi:hypothetical protein
VSVIQGANETATELYFARRDGTIPYGEVEPRLALLARHGTDARPAGVAHADRSRDAARVVRLTAGPKGDRDRDHQTEKLTKSYWRAP